MPWHLRAAFLRALAVAALSSSPTAAVEVIAFAKDNTRVGERRDTYKKKDVQVLDYRRIQKETRAIKARKVVEKERARTIAPRANLQEKVKVKAKVKVKLPPELEAHHQARTLLLSLVGSMRLAPAPKETSASSSTDVQLQLHLRPERRRLRADIG